MLRAQDSWQAAFDCALPDIRVPAANQMHSAVNMCGRAQMLLINFSKSGGTVGKSRT